MEDINNYNGNIDNDIIMENSLSEMYDEVYLKYESKKNIDFFYFSDDFQNMHQTDNETSRTCTVDLTFEYVPSEDPYTYGTEYVTGTIHCTCSDPRDANGLPTTVTFDHISSESPNRDISCYMVMGKKGSSDDYTNYHLNIYYTGYPY